MELLTARLIRLMWDGNQICALVGKDLQAGCGGFGSTVPEALRDLAARLEADDMTVWVPQQAKQFIEDGVLKVRCPECGHVKAMPSVDRVFAYMCPACSTAVEVAQGVVE